MSRHGEPPAQRYTWKMIESTPSIPRPTHQQIFHGSAVALGIVQSVSYRHIPLDRGTESEFKGSKSRARKRSRGRNWFVAQEVNISMNGGTKEVQRRREGEERDGEQMESVCTPMRGVHATSGMNRRHFSHTDTGQRRRACVHTSTPICAAHNTKTVRHTNKLHPVLFDTHVHVLPHVRTRKCSRVQGARGSKDG